MFDPASLYDLAKYIQDERLKEAEQARLIDSLKTASAPVKAKKRFWHFNIKNIFTAKGIKHDRDEPIPIKSMAK
jgi:hypothetical protein